ncbi:hypothetical protein PNU17_12665 [Turicibacter sanguinis]|jgi:hypothetical protein|uniref:hypothetical protein n=1 Tax=Turicibacter sanguinis TaxID=154288 RepID=UPI0012BBCE1A|nr:hypothetical protein [Turicibacter sanguinis]MCU7197869.1 hypothetical protein [Turicibacter sanguinis]MDB8556618.1 hypothetical protein [Turicibacter sanguinis]MDB8559414.1 hypothetical protein [Turicibacter sanguinis]MDB8562158.1 hypothetical protein [Turicibacter sanguinis]MDB8566233.1 hypothetical protein [Turicibacter sanguinis]
MNEQNKTLSFEASYTLDVISLLDLLFSGEMGEDTELIRYFEEQLSENCEVSLNKVRNTLPKGESIGSTLIPLIATDSEFNDLRLSELLQSPKYLVTQLKKQTTEKQFSKSYKKFLTKDLEKVFEQLSLVIAELERCKFKNFWLETRLPLINDQIKRYDKESQPLNVIEILNQSLTPQHIEKRIIYVVSFDLLDLKSIQLFNEDVVVSIKLSTKQAVECLTEQLLQPISIHKRLKARVRTLKHDKVLLNALKQVKEEYKDLGTYLEANVKLAYQMYLNDQLHLCDQPYQYLGRYQFGKYKLSTLFYHYMQTHPKLNSKSITDYLIEVVEQVELDQFDQRYMSIMSRTL